LASNGDYLINGISYSNNGNVTSPANGGRDYWIVRLSPSLTVPWNYCLGTSGDEWGISIVEDTPGCYIATGNGYGKFITGHGGFDFWTAKVCDNTLNSNEFEINKNNVILFQILWFHILLLNLINK